MTDDQPLTPPFPLGPGAIENVMGVWRFTLGRHHRNRWRSLPGHVVHCVCSGRYRLVLSGGEYRVGPGDIVYFHEAEQTEWVGGADPIVFFSVHFLAPDLPPPPAGRRKFRAPRALAREFEALYRSSQLPLGPRRTSFLYASLYRILGHVFTAQPARQKREGEEGWWRVETLIRKRRLFRISLSELCALSGQSRSMLFRKSKRATGRSPAARIREIRLEEAKGLLLFSSMTVSEIAAALQYGRVHEFSREFAQQVGVAPTVFAKEARTRTAGPARCRRRAGPVRPW